MPADTQPVAGAGKARAVLSVGSRQRAAKPLQLKLRCSDGPCIATVSADVHEANTAAIALFEAAGARRTGSNLELVIH